MEGRREKSRIKEWRVGKDIEGGRRLVVAASAEEEWEEVIEEIAEGSDESGDIGPSGGVEDLSDAGDFFIGADEAHFGEDAFGA